METGNLLGQIPIRLPEELFQTLASGVGMRIERIVSKGHASPPDYWYEQPEAEWVMVVKGEAKLRFEQDDRLVHMAEGDYVNIAARERHRVEWTREDIETVWLAVFYQE